MSQSSSKDNLSKSPSIPPFQGSCLCGGVTFEVQGFSPLAANCYCSMCQKFHGAPFGTLVGVTGLVWQSGTHLLKEFTSDNGSIRTFCSECGSSIGFRGKNSTEQDIELAIALFNSDIPVETDANIYTNYKANWCKITDDLPCFAEGRND